MSQQDRDMVRHYDLRRNAAKDYNIHRGVRRFARCWRQREGVGGIDWLLLAAIYPRFGFKGFITGKGDDDL